MSAAPVVVRAAQHLLARLQKRSPTSAGLSAERVLNRSDSIPLQPSSRVSPNGSCRLLRARDGWIALNTPRAEDHELLPAWIGEAVEAEAWSRIDAVVAQQSGRDLVSWGAELGLAVALLGEAQPRLPTLLPIGTATASGLQRRLNVVDLSTLWAGPLCGAILADAGHVVTKIEAQTRPDPVATATPLLDRRLNGGKTRRTIGRFAAHDLLPLLAHCDVLITSARPRAFEGAGLSPEVVFAANPALIWVAVTAHGGQGEAATRVGFGDDAGVAGGLVSWDTDGEPLFAGDAVADPLTGLAAAAAAFDAVAAGGGVLIDAAMAPTAAWCAQA